MWMMTKKKTIDDMPEVFATAARVINVHLIKSVAVGLVDDPYGVYRLLGFLSERTGLVVFVFFGFHRWTALVL
jgi:hypothetical protein